VADSWADRSPAVWPIRPFPVLLAGLVLSIWLYQYAYESRFRTLVSAGPVRAALIVGMLVYMAAVVTSGNQEFIYFRF
jgi:hypothetical protein